VRTDPDDDLAHRFDAIESARTALGKGNRTDAIVAACDHAAQDARAKRRAIETLVEHVEPAVAAAILEDLSTARMPLAADLVVQEGDADVEVRVGPQEDTDA